MAVITPPAYLQSGSHSAQGDRQVVSALAGQDVETFTNGVSAVGMGHGLVRSGHLAVSEKSGTPNMSVDVAKGIALVTGSSSLAQGVYVFANDATVNLAIATADATNPRYDLVIAQVRDNTEDSGGSNDARLAVVTGTPAASPADPAVPAGCLVLARVEVDALASSIVNADITTLAGLARGSAWNQAWGVVARGSKTSDQGGFSSTTDITGLTATWTAVPGRLYRISVYGNALSTVASDLAIVAIQTSGSTNVQTAQFFLPSSGISSVAVSAQVVLAGLSGSVTYKTAMARISGSGTLQWSASATSPGQFIVEDCGPA